MKSIQNIFKTFKRHRRTQYLSICLTFFILFTGTLLMGMTHRYDTHKEITKVYQHTPLSSNEMILTKRVYNPDKHLYRLDFYIQSDGGMNTDNRFLSDKLSVNNVSPEDPAKHLPTTLIRVTPQYYVMYVKDVPTQEMRTELNYTPSFTNESTTSSTEESVKLYSSKQDTTLDSHLNIVKDKPQLQCSLIDYQCHALDQTIERCQKSIKKHEATIQSLEKEIQVVEKEMTYEIGEEKASSTERLTNLKSKIDEENQTIEEKKEKIKESRKQKVLLDEQKKTLIEK